MRMRLAKEGPLSLGPLIPKPRVPYNFASECAFLCYRRLHWGRICPSHRFARIRHLRLIIASRPLVEFYVLL